MTAVLLVFLCLGCSSGLQIAPWPGDLASCEETAGRLKSETAAARMTGSAPIVFCRGVDDDPYRAALAKANRDAANAAEKAIAKAERDAEKKSLDDAKGAAVREAYRGQCELNSIHGVPTAVCMARAGYPDLK